MTLLEERITDALGDTFVRNGLSPSLTTKRLSGVVEDATSVFIVGDKRTPAVLLISPEQFPDVVSVEQEKSARMKEHLGPEIGSVILTPIALGRYMGRSYALLPLKKQLSDNRVLWAIQRRSIKTPVTGWLRQMQSASTIAESSSSIYFRSLKSLADMDGLDDNIKSIANAALHRLLNGTFQPRITPMHDDLWKGNILLPSAGDQVSHFPFFVIDWRGSRIDGFPFFDLIRLSMSLLMGPRELRYEIEQTCNILGCKFADAPGYIAVALGEISLRSDQFPRREFLQMAHRCFSELQKATD